MLEENKSKITVLSRVKYLLSTYPKEFTSIIQCWDSLIQKLGNKEKISILSTLNMKMNSKRHCNL